MGWGGGSFRSVGGGEAPSEIGDGVGFMWVFEDGWERLVIRRGERGTTLVVTLVSPQCSCCTPLATCSTLIPHSRWHSLGCVTHLTPISPPHSLVLTLVSPQYHHLTPIVMQQLNPSQQYHRLFGTTFVVQLISPQYHQLIP